MKLANVDQTKLNAHMTVIFCHSINTTTVILAEHSMNNKYNKYLILISCLEVK